MNFRYARHTNNLEPLIEFYTEIVGLEKLGEFKNEQNNKKYTYCIWSSDFIRNSPKTFFRNS